MENIFLGQTLSLLSLLLITIGVYLFSKKHNLPYTIILVLTGILLIPISQLSFFSFIGDFQLTPNILFYVFLPILLFESAYNITYRELVKDWKSISLLAVVGLIISAIIIASILYYILPFLGIEISFLMALLFGSLISATDPVAVLALFKSLGAPKRLTLIFEGESLFNDGTALALFVVILGILVDGTALSTMTFIEGLGSFLSMALGGAIFGGAMGIMFSKVIQHIKNNETIEIMLTMIVAHLTFLLAELITHHVSIGSFHLALSGVIATTFAAIVMGNYGRHKISPKVEEYMEKFWGFFAFISNSLVFILLGLIVNTIDIPLKDLRLPILISIITVMIARAISIYIPLFFFNYFNTHNIIPLSWQHLLARGSLRGALAIMMVLMIPDSMIIETHTGTYSLQDFLMVITIGCILFTLFLKAPAIIPLMRHMKINQPNAEDNIGYMEGIVLMNLKAIDKLQIALEKGYITHEEYTTLHQKYKKQLKKGITTMNEYCTIHHHNITPIIEKTISLHALGIEKQYLKELFTYNEVDEQSFNEILYTIRRQIERIERNKPQIKSLEEKMNLDIYQQIRVWFDAKPTPISTYIKYRAKVIITRKVIKELKHLQSIDFGFDKSIFDKSILLYQDFHTIASERKNDLFKHNKNIITQVESQLMEKSIFKLEEKIIHNLYEKNIISHTTYQELKEQINNDIVHIIR